MIIDIVIIILVAFSILLGLKRGFTRELVSCVGFILCLIGAFLLKNPVSSFMYDHLPFFTFNGVIKGVTVLNILVYEVLAFLIVFFLLLFVLRILMLFTKIFEGILNATIILGIPSKILGGVLGLIKGVVICFLALFVLSLPVFKFSYLNQSKIGTKLLKYTPILSGVTNNTRKVFDEFNGLVTKYKDVDNSNQFNLDSLDIFLKYDIISIDSADKLYKNGKLNTIKNIDGVLDKYR